MYSYEAIKSELNIKDLRATMQYQREFNRAHPEYMKPDGLIVFCGGQGAGKTLSAVRYISRLKKLYPGAVLVSNINLYIPGVEVLPYEGIDAVKEMDNGFAGIILLLDEIQVEFSNLDQLHKHPSIIATISQQRKRRLHVIGTTQLFKRLAKPWREQCNAIVDCESILGGKVQINKVVDLGTIAEDSSGNLTTYDYSDRFFWFRSKKYFEMYDTLERVNRKGVLMNV